MKRITDLNDCVGKTIKSIEKATFSNEGVFDRLKIVFNDNSFIEFESFDYNGYVSGIIVRKR